jgi:RNA polymerase sigma-70 factor, ECF subfamily
MVKMAESRDLRTFFLETYPSLFRFVFSRTEMPAEDVEDLVQEAIAQGWQRRGEFLGNASLETWLFSIARHKIADYWRSRRRAAPRIQEAVARMGEVPLPEELLGTVEMRERVAGALERLDPDYARVLTLRYLEDLPVRAVAERLGESESAVESRLTRAREAFRLLMGEAP